MSHSHSQSTSLSKNQFQSIMNESRIDSGFSTVTSSSTSSSVTLSSRNASSSTSTHPSTSTAGNSTSDSNSKANTSTSSKTQLRINTNTAAFYANNKNNENSGRGSDKLGRDNAKSRGEENASFMSRMMNMGSCHSKEAFSCANTNNIMGTNYNTLSKSSAKSSSTRSAFLDDMDFTLPPLEMTPSLSVEVGSALKHHSLVSFDDRLPLSPPKDRVSTLGRSNTLGSLGSGSSSADWNGEDTLDRMRFDSPDKVLNDKLLL
jgi:hypothetical protein